MSNIAVVGAGYVGLVTASCFAEFGHKVNVLEIDPARLSILREGRLPVTEPGLPDLWQRHSATGKLTVTDDYAQGLSDVQFAFIAVGTPSESNGKPDLTWLRSAARSIARAANEPITVVVKSTVPVGTSEEVARILARFGRRGQHFSVVSNPEFLREGLAVFDFMHPTRIVVGSADQSSARLVADLYARLDSPTVFCDNRTAEMSKYASNVFLASRISFINEIASLCDAYGVDVTKVAKVTGMEPRCGEGYLGAGVGWGGSCLPKDVRGLIYMAKRRQVPLPLIKAVNKINLGQPHVAVKKLRRFLGDLQGRTIGVLGLSFKANSDDMREASSISIISLLQAEGSRVKAYDPLAMPSAAKLMPDVVYCSSAYEVADGSDAIVLVTDWDEFKDLDMKRLASSMNHPVLIDGRNFYDPDEISRVPMAYAGIGRRAAKTGKHDVVMVGELRT